MKIDIGKMNNRITIQKFEKYKDENKITREGWKDYKTVWAYVNNLYGKEYIVAYSQDNEKTIDFIIRYCKEFEAIESDTFRVKWNNKIYNIVFPDHMQYSKQLIKLKCELIKK